MSDQLLEYENHFLPNQTVRIAFIGNTSLSVQDAITRVTSLTRDLLELELEEQQLPTAIAVSLGDILELRSGKSGHSFRCRGLLVSGTSSRYLLIRLVGNVIYEELREYFRIDSYLPVRYIPIPDQDLKSVQRKWLYTVDRRGSDRNGLNHLTSFMPRLEPAKSASPGNGTDLPIQAEPPVAANISGGGLRTCIPEDLQPGSFALLEIFLPGAQPRIIDVAAEVLSTEPAHLNDEIIGYSIPFKFTCIEERDRDAIISHIQSVQQRQISLMTDEMPVLKRSLEQLATSTASRFSIFRHRLFIVGLLFLAALTLYSLVSYYRNPYKSGVQIIFEAGLQKYLDKLHGQEP